MKRFLFSVLGLVICFFAMGAKVNAMVVASPVGTLYPTGYYKDSVAFNVRYGIPSCSSIGIFYQYTYTTSSALDGTHDLYFYNDGFTDNPYIVISPGGTFDPIVTPLTCPHSGSTLTSSQFIRSFLIFRVDAYPPSVSISSPMDEAVFTQSKATIKGQVTDSASGVKNAHAIINGSLAATAVITGNTYSVDVTLEPGMNEITMQATDNVDHIAESTSITLNYVIGSGTTAPTPTTSQSGTSFGTPAPAATSAKSSSIAGNVNLGSPSVATPILALDIAGSTANVKFYEQQQLKIRTYDDNIDKTSTPNQLLAENNLGTSSTLLYGLLALALVLIVICGYVIIRVRPMFAQLHQAGSGLRLKILLIVTLPSLIPLLGLGSLGYRQLTNSVKSSLSQQLAKASQTSAQKLEREFSIRRKIIAKSSSDILQIQGQIAEQHKNLADLNGRCESNVRKNIPAGKYTLVTSSNECLPFLAGFAQLANPSSSTLNSYVSALSAGFTKADADLSANELQRTDQILASLRLYFPDITELALTNNKTPSDVVATLPVPNGETASAIATHKDLIPKAVSDSLIQLDSSLKPRALLLTYPLAATGGKSGGGVIAAINLDQEQFIKPIYSSTPKPNTEDLLFIADDSGKVVYPESSTKDNYGDNLKNMVLGASTSKIYELTKDKEKLIARQSPVSGTNWSFITAAPEHLILAPLAGVQKAALLAITVFILLSILLGIGFVASVAGSINKIVLGALAFGRGDLDYRIGLKSHDEMQVLGQTMDDMASQIKAAQIALIEKDKEFISVATHELKAPMTAIIGNLSLIMQDGMGQVDQTASELIDQAYKGTIRLRELVTDMLDVARLEAGKASFNLVPLNVTDLAQSIIVMQEVAAREKNITLQHNRLSDLTLVMADKIKLEIILTNFISNAIKYNRPDGTITLGYKQDGDKVVVVVADTGLGIPEEQKAHMFEKFFRVQNADRTSVPGTGLGMYLTRKFIEGMGGTVWFDSVHGQGTTFYFTVPIAPKEPVMPSAATTSVATESVPIA